MSDEYDVLIDDLFMDETTPTAQDIRQAINKKIRSNRAATKTAKGLEIDVPDSWVDVLQNDAAILYDYGAVGWKVMWYQTHSEGPGEGDLIRSWLSVKDKRHIAKEMR
mgnify:CR=1 FL=1